MSKEKIIGEVVHYFTSIALAAVRVKDEIKTKESLHFKGKSTDFYQKIDSIQIIKIDSEDIKLENINKAKKNQEVIIRVKERVRRGDKIYFGKEISLKKKSKKLLGNKKNKKLTIKKKTIKKRTKRSKK